MERGGGGRMDEEAGKAGRMERVREVEKEGGKGKKERMEGEGEGRWEGEWEGGRMERVRVRGEAGEREEGRMERVRGWREGGRKEGGKGVACKVGERMERVRVRGEAGKRGRKERVRREVGGKEGKREGGRMERVSVREEAGGKEGERKGGGSGMRGARMERVRVGGRGRRGGKDGESEGEMGGGREGGTESDCEVIDFTRSRVKTKSKLTNLMKVSRIDGYNGNKGQIHMEIRYFREIFWKMIKSDDELVIENRENGRFRKITQRRIH